MASILHSINIDFHLKQITYFNIDICVRFCLIFVSDGSEKLTDTSPGAASISSIDIANEFAGLSYEEQDRLRAEWSQVQISKRNLQISLSNKF